MFTAIFLLNFCDQVLLMLLSSLDRAGFENLFKWAFSGSVSYTHLDVYKRQSVYQTVPTSDRATPHPANARAIMRISKKIMKSIPITTPQISGSSTSQKKNIPTKNACLVAAPSLQFQHRLTNHTCTIITLFFNIIT